MRTRNHLRKAALDADDRDMWDDVVVEGKASRLVKERSVAIGRDKQKKADLKSFRLRGFRGHGVPRSLEGVVTPKQFREMKARKRRLLTGTEVHGPYRKFASGLSAKKKEPWERRQHKVAPVQIVEKKQRHISALLNKWHTTHQLPSLELGEVASWQLEPLSPMNKKRLLTLTQCLSKSGVNRAIIEMLLIRGGIEENPGPEGEGPCSNVGKAIAPKWELVNKQKKLWVGLCPICGMLIRPAVQKNKMPDDKELTFHATPDDFAYLMNEEESDSSSEVDAALLNLPPVPSTSKGEGCSSTADAPEAGAVVASTVPVMSKAEGKEPEVQVSADAPEARVEKLRVKVEPHVTEKVTETSSGIHFKMRNKPSPPESGDSSNGHGPVLDGYYLSDLEVSDFMVTQHLCQPETVRVETKTFVYEAERRIVNDRSVKETKQDFYYVHMSGTGVRIRVPIIGHIFAVLLWLLTVKARMELFVWAPIIVSTFGLTMQVLVSASWMFTWLFFVFALPWLLMFAAVACYAAYAYRGLLNHVTHDIQTMLLDITRSLWVTKHVYYVPHVLANVIPTYDRGTSSRVVEQTVVQRIARLSTLPLPDKYYTAFTEGSSAVCVWVISKQPFFDEALGPL